MLIKILQRNNFAVALLIITAGCASRTLKTPPPSAAAPTVTSSIALTSTSVTKSDSQALHSDVLPDSLEAAVNSSYRTPENAKRDQYRHPRETLAFFGLKPKMTLVEITPGAGWYTEILAPYLATSGQYIAAIPPAGANAVMNETSAKVIAWIKSHKEFNGHVKVADFAPPDNLILAPDGSADMVVTFRNIHNWMAKGYERAVFESFFRALKPGGILGIEEHRENPNAKRDGKAASGYVLEKDVIRLAESIGFKFESKSEINANKKDSKDHPEGVWTLPPTLKLKDKNREKYLAIGESDRMTLKFVKPNK